MCVFYTRSSHRSGLLLFVVDRGGNIKKSSNKKVGSPFAGPLDHLPILNVLIVKEHPVAGQTENNGKQPKNYTIGKSQVTFLLKG